VINDSREEFAEVIKYYDLWRQISRYFGKTPGDEPFWQDGRLHFRTDYLEKAAKWPEWEQYGDWAAYIIEPRAEGCYNVLNSLRHEWASKRSEELEVAFSRASDAGKYILAH
jgi:hypothetical protein